MWRRSFFSPVLEVRQRRAKPWLHPRFVAKVEIKAVMTGGSEGCDLV